MKFFAFLIITLWLCAEPNAKATDMSLTREMVLKILHEKSQFARQVNENNPDFVVTRVLQALEQEKLSHPEQVLQLLEPLHERIFYSVSSQEALNNQMNLYVGSVFGFRIWREVAYLLLARAYYEMGRYSKSIENFRSIPADSELYDLASIGLGWSYLETNQISMIERDVFNRRLALQNPMLQSEFNLLQSLIQISKGQFVEAIANAKDVLRKVRSVPLAHDLSIQSQVQQMGFKVLAEGSFRHWLKHSNDWTFNQKILALQEVIDTSNQIDRNHCDDECLFFIAEAYWNLASTLRVEDPVKYSSKAKDSLETGYSWLRPGIQLSLSTHKAKVSEDAYFLAIALLWEQNLYADAIPLLNEFHRLFPQGRYREDTYQILADYYFNSGTFPLALKTYRSLVEVASPEKSAYGVYKAAWTLYNLQDTWAALRHMERLVSYYHKQKESLPKTEMSSGSSLAKEATRDMLRFLAEVTPARQGIEELGIFSFSRDELDDIESQLAFTYKEMGRFDDAKTVLTHLLDTRSQRPNAYRWLSELLDSDLRAATREQIVKHFQKYFPNLSSNREALEPDFAKVILTLHREAKKTDDPEIWLVVHEAYPLFNHFFPNSAEASIWYHGAQILETDRQLLNAIDWFRKAASIPKFENHEDAALSILRVAKTVADQLSLETTLTEAHKAQYQTILRASQWYVQNFKDTIQKNAADLIILEALHFTGQDKEAENYLIALFKTPKDSEEVKLQVVKSRLLREKKWEEAYSLCDRILVTYSTDDLKLCKQESAFQIAYDNKTHSPEFQQIWYEKAIQSHFQTDLSLKSWNNLFQTYMIPSEFKKMHEQARTFEAFLGKIWPKKNQPIDPNIEALAFNILLKIANACTLVGEDIEFTHWAQIALEINRNHPKADSLRWQVALILGQYQQGEAFTKALHDLEINKSSILKQPEMRRTIARLLFWNGQIQNAEHWIQISDDNPESQLLIRDLFFSSKEETPLRAFLKQNKKKLSESPLLAAIWRPLENHEERKLSRYENSWNKQSLESASKDFATRLEMVKQTISQWTEKSKQASQGLQAISLEDKSESLCTLKSISAEALNDLNQISLLPQLEAEPSWGAYQKKLKEKLNELENTEKKYNLECQKTRERVVFIREPKCLKIVQPCFESGILPQDPTSKITQWKAEHGSRSQLVKDLLNNRSVSLAHFYAQESQSSAERLYLIGIIRLYQYDLWNASLLFEEAIRLDPKQITPSSLLLSYMTLEQGEATLAKKYFNRISADQITSLAGWEQELYLVLNKKLSKAS